MKLEEAIVGESVRYIPTHVEGNVSHSDCENGVVYSKTSKYIFVRYIRNGILQVTPSATFPEDLIQWT